MHGGPHRLRARRTVSAAPRHRPRHRRERPRLPHHDRGRLPGHLPARRSLQRPADLRGELGGRARGPRSARRPLPPPDVPGRGLLHAPTGRMDHLAPHQRHRGPRATPGRGLGATRHEQPHPLRSRGDPLQHGCPPCRGHHERAAYPLRGHDHLPHARGHRLPPGAEHRGRRHGGPSRESERHPGGAGLHP